MVTAFFLLVLVVGAEKKIELQDIEEDNLRSEGKKDHDKSDSPQSKSSNSGTSLNSLEMMKSGFLRLFENPQSHPVPQQQRYIHQYAVTEQPEKHAPVPSKFGPGPQHAMVGYLSNMPMQIYIVPQYYTDHQVPQSEQPQVDYLSNSVSTTANNYHTYSTDPSYTETTGKPFEHYATPPAVTYIYQTQPTAPPAIATVAPVLAYQVPMFQIGSRVVTPSTAPKAFYANPEYTDSNSLDEIGEQEPKQYSTQTEVPYLPTVAELPRHYNSRAPIREPFRHNQNAITDLPHPNPLLLRAPPPHLSHIPRTLPMFRPLTKSVYREEEPVTNPYLARPHGQGLPPHSHFKKRPVSLLDSYIPSSLQVEYLKRGLAKDPSSLYDALSSGRFPNPLPRHYERGFLPNQMYPTGNGGVAYGHYKRNPKVEKNPHK
ncbi:hypothetical protein HF086_009849 [Spodoptera exigua]|uniref:Uncharacterized protein n=1 Tax=Spodoptera exigua TaxID=7107 RepID=A0A922SNQ9_SPOEX|nr:hypothetical protein HF086_009849 [Spodoptera exigua]